MKRFLSKLLLFTLPVFLYFTMNYFLVNKIAYRPYEAISFYQPVPYLGNFYPDTEIDMPASVGDLCHHTGRAIKREEYWKTDKLGFRNYSFVEKPDIIFIGDSFFAGSGLTQAQTIDNSVKQLFGNSLAVYNMAPSSLSQFDLFLRNGIIKKPKLIVYSRSERLDIEEFKYSVLGITPEKLSAKISNSSGDIFVDKLKRFYLFRYLIARLTGRSGTGKAGTEGSNMYFFKGRSVPEKGIDDAIKNAARLITYREYCDSLDIDFVFLPMPNKESVYYDLVPLNRQPRYLFMLDSILVKANVRAINTLEIYINYRETNSGLLYQPDDTHWNSNAVVLLSKEIEKRYSNLLKR